MHNECKKISKWSGIHDMWVCLVKIDTWTLGETLYMIIFPCSSRFFVKISLYPMGGLVRWVEREPNTWCWCNEAYSASRALCQCGQSGLVWASVSEAGSMSLIWVASVVGEEPARGGWGLRQDVEIEIWWVASRLCGRELPVPGRGWWMIQGQNRICREFVRLGS